MSRKEPSKFFFPLPNEVFNLGLSHAEIAIYSYLMRCENRDTHQCYPGYKTIGKAVNLSTNTVKKYVDSLCERHLITVEHTNVVTDEGMKRNGTLCYTILPIKQAMDYFTEYQFRKMAEDEAAHSTQLRLEAFERERQSADTDPVA